TRRIPATGHHSYVCARNDSRAIELQNLALVRAAGLPDDFGATPWVSVFPDWLRLSRWRASRL
ncbi:MAG: hypothetical protein ACXW3M_08760, partial [Rhodoplanes sp.]